MPFLCNWTVYFYFILEIYLLSELLAKQAVFFFKKQRWHACLAGHIWSKTRGSSASKT